MLSKQAVLNPSPWVVVSWEMWNSKTFLLRRGNRVSRNETVVYSGNSWKVGIAGAFRDIWTPEGTL